MKPFSSSFINIAFGNHYICPVADIAAFYGRATETAGNKYKSREARISTPGIQASRQVADSVWKILLTEIYYNLFCTFVCHQTYSALIFNYSKFQS